MKNQKRKSRKSKKGFAKVPNAILFNTELTLAEKALLAEFYSNPPEWITYQNELFGRSMDGKKQQKRALDHLIQLGFIRVAESMNRNSKGQFKQYEYYLTDNTSNIISERPIEESMAQEPVTGLPETDSPGMEKPITDKPVSVESVKVNGPISNTEYISNTEEVSNTDLNKTEKEIRISKSNTEIPENTPKEAGFNAPTKEEVIAFFEQEGSNAKAALAFFAEFNSRDWFTVRGEKVVNWKGMARKTMPKLNAANFELSNHMKLQIKSISQGLYEHLHRNVRLKCEENGNYASLNFTESDVRACINAFCVKHLINDFEPLRLKIVEANPDLHSFRGFKEALGLNTNNGIGRRHV